MSYRVGLVLLVLIISACRAAPTLQSGQESSPLELLTREWSSKPVRGGFIRIVNELGEVHLRNSDDGMVTLLEAVQARSAPERNLQVQVERNEHSLILSYPAAGRAADTRVDLAVLVPPGFPVEVRTVDGRVEARKLHNQISVVTRSGNIVVSTDTRQQLVSLTGQIRAYLIDSPKLSGSSYQTQTGDISMFIPDRPFSLQASTDGLIESELPLETFTCPRSACARMGVLVSDWQVMVQSETGNIDLFRIPIANDGG
jgi:hypothetical protein